MMDDKPADQAPVPESPVAPVWVTGRDHHWTRFEQVLLVLICLVALIGLAALWVR